MTSFFVLEVLTSKTKIDCDSLHTSPKNTEIKLFSNIVLDKLSFVCCLIQVWALGSIAMNCESFVWEGIQTTKYGVISAFLNKTEKESLK